MYLQQFLGLALSALLTINTGSVIHPAITWLNNSSLNITIGSSVNYYFDLEFNEWYPASGSVDTGGTGRCDTNIIIGNGTDPMTGFIQYERSSVTRGTNLISYDENVAVTSNMIYFYNVSSFTLTTFTSTDTGDLNQPTFTVTFTDGLIWSESDSTDTYNLVNSMQANISSIKTYEQSIYGQILQMALDLGYTQEDIDSMTTNIVSIDSKMDNIMSYLSTINSNIINVNNTLKNYFLDESYHVGYIRAINLFNTKFSQTINTNYDSIYIRGFKNFNNNNTSYDFLLDKRKKSDNILVFLCSSFSSAIVPTLVNRGTNVQNTNYTLTNYVNYSRPYLVGFRFTQNEIGSEQWTSILFGSANSTYYPIYWGSTLGIPDQIANELGFDKYEEVTSPINEANSALEQAAGTEEAFSQQTQQNFTNQIGQISTTDSVVTNSSFQRSANWVATQFNNLTNNNAFGSILGFSLLLGLAMAIIGRVIK